MGLELHYKEGQTPIDEDEKEGLLIRALSTQDELNAFEQLNIESAIEWSMHLRLNSEKVLSEKFIKQLHKKMFADVWKWAGEFRKSNKNIGVEWTQIGVQLKSLIDDTKYWILNKVYPPEEISIRFKHRLVSIHCFPNGNGRHSRLMADIMMESIFEKEIFTWHQSNMIKADETRMGYITALREADKGNIEGLIEFAQA